MSSASACSAQSRPGSPRWPRRSRPASTRSGTPSTAARTRSSADPPTRLGRSWEFTHIARVHCWYEDFLATLARAVLFSDTDAFTTSVFHEVYLGTPATEFEELVERRYDLFVVCGLDVPWRHDGIREFEAQRRAMHDRYVERARRSGSPWLLVVGPPEVRLAAAAAEVERLLDEP